MSKLDLDSFAVGIRRKIKRMSRTFDEFAKEGHRYADGVYGCYAALRARNEARKTVRKIEKMSGITPRKDRHAISSLIRASSDLDHRERSRLTMALRYAWLRRDDWDSLADFFKKNHGVRGCATAFRKYIEQRRRLRKEHRRPILSHMQGRSFGIGSHPRRLPIASTVMFTRNPERRSEAQQQPAQARVFLAGSRASKK